MKKYFHFLPPPFDQVAFAVLVGIVFLSFIAVSALFFIWLERKVSGRIQDRLGPTRVGGKYGWLQTIADGIKLLVKEDTRPTIADRFLFLIAPYIGFVASFCAFISLPFSTDLVGIELQVSAFFVLAILSNEIFAVILAGYASGSKWSLFGGIREAAQVVSYEIPRSICVVIPVILAGSLSLNTIGQQQGGYFWNWFMFHDPFSFLSFFLFFVVATASCKRAPFDLAEAESELVAGFHTEYSGLRWSFFFMAEYGSMFAVSAVCALLYCGGWHTGFLAFDPSTQWGWFGHLFNAIVLILKGYFFVFVMMWMRWSLPRLRIDQVMITCLKYFLPIACALLIGTCLWELFVPSGIENMWQYVISISSLLALILILGRMFVAPIATTHGQLPGAWQLQPATLTEGKS